MKNFNRRDFIKTSLAGSVATAYVPFAGTILSPGDNENTATRVAVTSGDDRADLAFRALHPFSKQIKQSIGNRRVVLKPNNVFNCNQLACTHVDTLEGILEFLKSINKLQNVIIAESPASGPAFDAFENYGYYKLVPKYPVKLIDLDKEPFDVMYGIIEKDLRPHDIRISRLLLDRDPFVISVARLKTHSSVIATLSLKNIVLGATVKDVGYTLYEYDIKFNKAAVKSKPGTVSDKSKFHTNSRWINFNIFQVARYLRPHLAVIDGYEGMEGNGPHMGTPVDHRVCIASDDWLAADRVGVELMGIDFANVGYLTFCAQAGYGIADLNKIEIIGEPLTSHIKTYKLPDNMEKMLSWMNGSS